MVRVQVPATTANMGPGFDTLGMALKLFNSIEMEELTQETLVIEVQGAGEQAIPRDSSNLVYQAAQRVFERLAYQPKGLRIKLINEIPVASGLGSSATAIVGGLVAANALAGNRLSKQELLSIATEMEGHPDNVAPALLGGIVISTQVAGEIKYFTISPPKGLKCILVTPLFPLSTKVAREVLPKQVTMQDAVFNIGRTALLVAALMAGDLELLQVAMEDKIHQPYRSALVPGMNEVFVAAKLAGAKGVALSGAGPTLIAFTDSQEAAIAQAMQETFLAHEVKSQLVICEPTQAGATLI